jgi:hypothetical protein
MNQKLKDAYDANMRAFINNEKPICFGRMEGMKEYAECVGDDEFIAYVSQKIEENRKDLEKACSG